ncbi:MAG: aminopeptidase P family protein [Calditrichia bacterium]
MSTEKISRIRQLMKEHGLNAYLIPGADPHNNEYLPERWKRREYVSGFTGSAGDVVITEKNAGLWTDSRYFLQAEQQLAGTGIQLYKIGLPDTPTIVEFLADNLPKNSIVGCDPEIMNHATFTVYVNQLKERDLVLKSVSPNLVDLIWDSQPDFPESPINPLEDSYTGETFKEKLERVRSQLKKFHAYAICLNSLDSIAWLFNIRGKDIEYNPVTIAYSLVTTSKAYLFVSEKKITGEIKDFFGNEVELLPYPQFEHILPELISGFQKIWCDPNEMNEKIMSILRSHATLLDLPNPIIHMKAVKNPVELKGFKSAHQRDGVAMVKFLYWLDTHYDKMVITEMSAEKKLEEFRQEQALFQGPSFRTISAFNEHGAIVHYASDESTDVQIKPNGIFLIDSGGQYLDGTTDITRTIAIGTPTHEQKEMFTLVLKGMIDLTISPFPEGTAGNQLDTIARLPLWKKFKNYGHGTGHGIGHYLNVHEGPHAISYYRGIGVKLEKGMIISNEPGFYKSGEYGIRIENIVVVDELQTHDEVRYFYLDTLTLCPIDLNLIEPSLLSNEEKNFLNGYHERVFEELCPYLTNEEKEWLSEKTKKI